MMIKICGITRREDAEAAVEAGASALGFVFYPPSPRYVTPERAAELGAGLEILKVGVFQDQTSASVETIMRVAKLDVAQTYRSGEPRDVRVWKAFRISGRFDAALGEGAEAVLLDGPANGISFDWSLVEEKGLHIILAGGLDAANVASAIRKVKPWGVDASSKLESAPGIKDHAKMREFIQAALTA